mgnify:CR=1 FL=1|jgi:hypothetical protein|tara:strand:- start:372 stop:767 length:396 start_codon:yes stop_codon:yes gene_type:complete
MEQLQRYIEEVGKDLVLDDFNIKEQSLRLPARKHYWVARLIEAKIERNQTFEKKKQLKRNITVEVIANSPVKLSHASAEQAAERHESLTALTTRLQELDMIIQYLEKVEKAMSAMGFDIKNVVELIKMEQM